MSIYCDSNCEDVDCKLHEDCDECGLDDNCTHNEPCSTNYEPNGKPMHEEPDLIAHPPHYSGRSVVPGIECIEVVSHFDFCLGNVIKYVWRAGNKDGEDNLTALRKAAWYLQHEIESIEIERAEIVVGREQSVFSIGFDHEPTFGVIPPDYPTEPFLRMERDSDSDFAEERKREVADFVEERKRLYRESNLADTETPADMTGIEFKEWWDKRLKEMGEDRDTTVKGDMVRRTWPCAGTSDWNGDRWNGDSRTYRDYDRLTGERLLDVPPVVQEAINRKSDDEERMRNGIAETLGIPSEQIKVTREWEERNGNRVENAAFERGKHDYKTAMNELRDPMNYAQF